MSFLVALSSILLIQQNLQWKQCSQFMLELAYWSFRSSSRMGWSGVKGVDLGTVILAGLVFQFIIEHESLV